MSGRPRRAGRGGGYGAQRRAWFGLCEGKQKSLEWGSWRCRTGGPTGEVQTRRVCSSNVSGFEGPQFMLWILPPKCHLCWVYSKWCISGILVLIFVWRLYHVLLKQTTPHLWIKACIAWCFLVCTDSKERTFTCSFVVKNFLGCRKWNAASDLVVKGGRHRLAIMVVVVKVQTSLFLVLT